MEFRGAANVLDKTRVDSGAKKHTHGEVLQRVLEALELALGVVLGVEEHPMCRLLLLL